MKIVDKNDYVSFDDIKSVEFYAKFPSIKEIGCYDKSSLYRIDIPRRYEYNVVYANLFQVHGFQKEDCLNSACVNVDDIERGMNIKDLIRKLFVLLYGLTDYDMFDITIRRYEFINKLKI